MGSFGFSAVVLGLSVLFILQSVASFVFGWYLRGRTHAKEPIVGDAPAELTKPQVAAKQTVVPGDKLQGELSGHASDVEFQQWEIVNRDSLPESIPQAEQSKSEKLPCSPTILMSGNEAVEAPTSNKDQKQNRRLSKRYPFLQTIYVAPRIGGGVVKRSNFQAVLCQNLSERGFAFYTNDRPRHKLLAVAIGNGTSERNFVAEVVHVTTLQDDMEHPYLVGCRFLERLPNTPAVSRPSQSATF